jgi:DNA polymerase-4
MPPPSLPIRDSNPAQCSAGNVNRRIAHLDMDAFYASVELLRYPELKGQAVVIGGRNTPAPVDRGQGRREFGRLRQYVGRGVVTTSTYEARALGVFSAMGMMKAAQLAPDAYLLPADFNAYRDYSRRFKAAVAEIAPCIEDRGIDEIYIDLTAFDEPSEVIGLRLKQAVFDATGLTCSIAISPNKLLSKIGSELQKPDGLTVLENDDIPTRIWPLAVSKINGIGPKSTQKLLSLGIETIAQLAVADAGLLQTHFGRTYASWLMQVAQGYDERPVVTYSKPKSVSRETTFDRDLHVVHDRAQLSTIFLKLCEKVAEDLLRKGMRGRTVGIKLRFEDFRTVTRDYSLERETDDAKRIHFAARQCLKRVEFTARVRLLGVRVSGLKATAPKGLGEPVGVQLPLY